MRKLIALATLFIVSLPATAATVRYSYQGADFELGSFSIPASLAGLSAISGYVDIDGGLASNLTSQSVSNVLAFEFFDGVTTINQANTSIDTFEVSTDANGNITAWLLVLPQLAPGTGNGDPQSMLIASDDSGAFPFPIYDSSSYASFVIIGTDIVPTTLRVRSESAGAWQIAAVPLPAAVWLLASALAGLGWFARRRAS